MNIVGRNNPCPCGSGRKYKKCCLDRDSLSKNWVKKNFLYVPEENIQKTNNPYEQIQSYIDYQELYGKTEFNHNSEHIWRDEIGLFKKDNYVLLLLQLHYYFSELYRKKKKEEMQYAIEILPDVDRKRIIQLWQQNRKYFTRQQMLSTIKMAIVEKKEGEFFVKGHASLFSRTLFRVTELIGNMPIKDTNAEMIRNLYFYHIECPTNFARYRLLYSKCLEEAKNKYFRESFPIREVFQKITGVDLETYLFLTFGLVAHYFQPKKELLENPQDFIIGSQYFNNLREPIQKKAEKILNFFSGEIEDFRNKMEEEFTGEIEFYYNFSAFWEKPFLKFKKNTYAIIDKEYLQEKATHGIYNVLLNNQLQDKNCSENGRTKSINRLNSFIGRCFEIYVRDIFKRIYPTTSKSDKRLFCEMEEEDTGGVDFIICYPDSIVLFEITTSSLPHRVWMSGDISEINKRIQKMLFSEENRKSKGKAFQLNNAVEKIGKGYIRFGQDYSIKNSKIYPIIVTEKLFPWVPPIVKNCKNWIIEKELLRNCINKFTIIDIEELEALEEIVTYSGLTFPQIFDEYFSSEYANWPFKNFLYYGKQKSDIKNSFLLSEMKNNNEIYFEKYFKR